MTIPNPDFQTDIDAVGGIDAASTILDVVCRITGMGFAAVARVTEDRWVACEVLDQIGFGLEAGGELAVQTTICNEIRGSREPVVINNVDQDKAYRGHPTPAMYGFQSYISMPIVRKDGSFFGTLCAIDPRPARLDNPETIGMFKLFAELIAFHLDANEQLESDRSELRDQKDMSELREQFIAVLGHDLRNPLASIDAGARMLKKMPLNERASEILTLIQGSVSRMEALIGNVLDFARGRMGGGIGLNRGRTESLQSALEQVVAEFRTTNPDRTIDAVFNVQETVDGDPTRLAQLLSNLLGNALTHGAKDAPVTVRVSSSRDGFELSVANAGEPIPEKALKRLFQPFYRGNATSNRGLGLGLYIASEIARAHDGTLRVDSSPEETRFTFRMKSD